MADHDFETVDSETLYVGKIFALRADEVRMPGGNTARREVVEHYGAVAILAMDNDGNIVMVYQYRHPVGRRLWELPAGLLDKPGEDPEEAARRELLEETGFAATTWTRLGSTWSSPGITGEVIHLYLAQGLAPADRGDFEAAHEEADMRLYWLPLDHLLTGVLSATIADAPVVNAVLLARAKGLV